MTYAGTSSSLEISYRNFRKVFKRELDAVLPLYTASIFSTDGFERLSIALFSASNKHFFSKRC
jgi:hypothetical protein